MSSTELKPIILYDIVSITPRRPWSPNTMKTRYCLCYKQLPFTTVWVELPDIAGLLQSKGIREPPYTLPAIEDPNTNIFVMDSLAIATYLDDKYPETPKVFSSAAREALEDVGDVFSSVTASGADSKRQFAPHLVFLVLAADRLNPVSRAYYHRMRIARLGEPWTALCNACAASAEERAERVRQGVEVITETWRKQTAVCERRSGLFVLGEEPCFVDFAIAGRIKFILDGLVPSEVDTVMNLEGGRLGRLVESLERYYKY